MNVKDEIQFKEKSRILRFGKTKRNNILQENAMAKQKKMKNKNINEISANRKIKQKQKRRKMN